MRIISVATREDRFYQRQQDLQREYAGECCDGGSRNVSVEYVSQRYFRGWVVKCAICGELIAELDE